MEIILAALAVFWAWEFFLVVFPWRVPPVLQPILVAGLGYLATLLDDRVLLPAAIAGLVGLLHSTVVSRLSPDVDALQFPRQRRRSALGSRIPNIP